MAMREVLRATTTSPFGRIWAFERTRACSEDDDEDSRRSQALSDKKCISDVSICSTDVFRSIVVVRDGGRDGFSKTMSEN